MDHRAELIRVTSSFDAFQHRDDSRELGTHVRRRKGQRGTVAKARRLTDAGLLIAGLIAATLVIGVVGWAVSALFWIVAALLAMILVYSLWPSSSGRSSARPAPAFKEDMPNRAVVKRLAAVLDRGRRGVPALAAQRIDAIGAQLPLLESRLEALDPLDPLAQDARRLMGQHLPELIERYERVPQTMRHERDGAGMTVDDRLVAGLNAAEGALADLGRQLTKGDLDAFETQGRFIESRYRDDAPGLEN